MLEKNTVLSILQQASSQDVALLKPAESLLARLETQPGFYLSLMDIVSDSQCESACRWLAAVYLKNGVDRYWRRGATNGLHENEKAAIREKLLQAFVEPINQLASQIAVVMGKVARFDCPAHWPALVPTLLAAVRTNDSFTQQKSLAALQAIVKAMASKRLAADRRLFEELTSATFTYVVALWHDHATACFTAIGCGDVNTATDHLNKATLVLKVLRKLIVFGFREVNQSTEAMHFLHSTVLYVDRFITAKNELKLAGTEQALLARDKILILLTKILLDVLDNHTESFAELIEATMQQAIRYSFQPQYQELLLERLTVNFFNLIRQVLSCDLYRPPKTPGAISKTTATAVACHAKQTIFSPNTVAEMTRCLLLNYLPLRETELAEWTEDVERFVTGGEGGDSMRFSLRPATEMLVVSVLKENHETSAPVLLRLVGDVTTGAVSADDLGALLKKDAVYNAVGLASFDLFDDINFDDWFVSTLVNELNVPSPMYKLIRRRIIWLLGCWLSVRMSQASRPLLYTLLTRHLAPDEDVVVRLESALTLKLALDDFAFKEDQFFPFVESIFANLFQLLGIVQTELKLHVLRVVNSLMERLGHHVRPYANTLGQLLPELWSLSADDNMLQITIITTLTSVVMALGSASVDLHPFLLPVIRYSVDVSQPQHVYLCEDGLELWLMTVHCAPTMSLHLHDVFPVLLPVLEMGTDNLRVSLQIIDAYVLLGQEHFLVSFMGTITSVCQRLIPDLKSEGVLLTYRMLETVLKLFPSEGAVAMVQLLPDIVVSVLEERDYPDVVAARLALLSRVLYHSQQVFTNVLDLVAHSKQQPSADVLADVVDVWLSKLENIILPDTKKMSIMALLTLLPTDQRVILDRFPSVINGVVESLYSVQRTSPDTVTDDDVATGDVDSDRSTEGETLHDSRLNELLHRDVLYQTGLRQFVRERLTLCEQYYGSERFTQLMQGVDVEVSRQLATLLADP